MEAGKVSSREREREMEVRGWREAVSRGRQWTQELVREMHTLRKNPELKGSKRQPRRKVLSP